MEHVPLSHFLSVNLVKFSLFFGWWQSISAKYHAVVTLRGTTENIWGSHQKQWWIDSIGEWGRSGELILPLLGYSQGSSAVNGWAGFLQLTPQPWSITFSSACSVPLRCFWCSPPLFIWPLHIHCQEPSLLVRSKSSLCGWSWFWGEPSQQTAATKQPQTSFAAAGEEQRLELTCLACLLASSRGFLTWAVEQNN